MNKQYSESTVVEAIELSEDIADVQQEVESKAKKEIKPKRVGRGASFLCPVCRNTDTLSLGRQENIDIETITLSCGHLRELALSPEKPGLVGIEDLDTALGMALFPYLEIPTGKSDLITEEHDNHNNHNKHIIESGGCTGGTKVRKAAW